MYIPETALYRGVQWQTEVMAAQTDVPGGRERSWGMYSGLEYQFARRWKAGARYDYSELPLDASLRDMGGSAYLTFVQSEFLFWRLAYKYTDLNYVIDGDSYEHELILQVDFGIGPHRAHKY